MRRTYLLLVFCVAQTMLFAGVALGQETSFSDDFTYFDTIGWSKGDHMLGRSYLDPTNVDGQNLRIKLPARTFEGGEVLTNELHGYGSYSARMNLPGAPGSKTGFFLYKAPDFESELDLEIYNDSTRRIMFTTYAGGRQTHTTTVSLPFDPTAGFHDYRFDCLYDPGSGRASVTFYVDGVNMSSWDTGVP